MGDSRRFDKFAELIAKQFPGVKELKIADVAGGKGILQRALREHGYSDVVTYDKRKNRSRGRRHVQEYRYFSRKVKDVFGLIVGMHPDEATDVIVTEALRRGVPFVVCPCCVKPCSTTFWCAKNFGNWIGHLKKVAQKGGYMVTEQQLRINGKNLVLIGRPTV